MRSLLSCPAEARAVRCTVRQEGRQGGGAHAGQWERPRRQRPAEEGRAGRMRTAGRSWEATPGSSNRGRDGPEGSTGLQLLRNWRRPV